MTTNLTKGIIPINKPAGWTSFDVVNKIKKLTHISRVGHLGTLDPMATGVLLVTVGSATKLFDLMQEKQKTYIAEFEFGYTTDTLDVTGKQTETTLNIPTLAQIKAVLPEFVGEIAQIPPKYSAKSVNGVRAYDLARKNIDFELKPKQVIVYSLEILDYKEDNLKLKIVCGSGTYIRALGRDIAEKLNSLATMTKLTRIQVGKFKLENCQEINNLTPDNIEKRILKLSTALDYNTISFNEADTKKILNGVKVNSQENDGIYLLNSEQDTIAIVVIKNKIAKMLIYLG